MEFVRKNHRLAILAGVGAAIGLAALLVRYWTREQLPPLVLMPTKNPSTLLRFHRDPDYQRMIAELQEVVAQEIKTGLLSNGSMSSIYKAVVQLTKTQYLTHLQKQRAERRRFLHNHRRYTEISLQATEENDLLLENATLEVVRDLQIDPAFFEKESQRHNKIDPNFSYLNLVYLEQVKSQLATRDKLSVPKQRFMEFMEFQIGHYKQSNFGNVLRLPVDKYLLIKQTHCADAASEKFGLEEEDFIVRQDLLLSIDFKDLIDRYQDELKTEEEEAYHQEVGDMIEGDAEDFES